MKYVRGFTFFEVLVTLIVISIGFLGIALLQATGMRNNNASIYRIQASIKLDDIAERMRANPAAVNDNFFSNVTTPNCALTLPVYCEEYSDNQNGPIVAAQSCTYTELASFDVTTWYCGIRSQGAFSGGVSTLFPMAGASIVCNDTDTDDDDACTDGSPHTITISWGELDPNITDSNEMTSQSVSTTIYP